MLALSREAKSSIGIFEGFLLFFTGLIALSTYANVLLDRIGVYLIELLLLPIVIYYIQCKKINLSGHIQLSMSGIAFVIILIASTTLGIINTGSAFSAITCIRPFIYILIIIKYIRGNGCILDVTRLYILSLGCLVGDYLYLFNYSSTMISRGYHHINIIAVATVMLVPLIQKRNVIIKIVSVAGALYISLISGYRINVLTCVVVVFSYALYKTIFVRSIKKRIAAVIFIVILTMALFWVINNFAIVSAFLTDLLNMNAVTSERIFGRFQLIIDKNMIYGDQSRLDGFREPFTYFLEYILPSGPVGKANAHRFGQYTDVPIMFFYDLFGSVGAWIFVIVCVTRFLKKLRISKWRIISEKITDYEKLSIILIPLTVCLFILNGTFITFVNISIMYALCIGGLFVDGSCDGMTVE